MELLETFTRYGFGMYLVHYMVVWMLPIQLLQFAPIISVPVSAIVTLLISLVVSKGIKCLPLIGKYVI